METIKQANWGIIGCGDVAEKKSGPALYGAENSRLVTVMRRDREKAMDFARRHGAARAYGTIDELLGDAEVNAVYIATPPYLHREQTLQAAAAGKHVLVEKPMALDASEAEEMIEACRSAGVHLHVAYYRRFYPKFIAAKRLLDRGAIGNTILGARLTMCGRFSTAGWRVDPAVSGGGHFVDVGSHRIDMLLYLLGDVDAVSGIAENRMGLHGAENDVAFLLRMNSGAVVSAGFHFHTQPSQDILEIYGSEGTLAIDPFDGETIAVRRDDGEREYRFPVPAPVHLPFVQALVDVYRGSAEAHVSGDEGIKTTRIIDEVLRAYRERAK